MEKKKLLEHMIDFSFAFLSQTCLEWSDSFAQKDKREQLEWATNHF